MRHGECSFLDSSAGSPANFAVFTGLLAPHDRIMGQVSGIILSGEVATYGQN